MNQKDLRLLAEVAAAFALRVNDLTGRSRDSKVSLARQVAMLVLYRRGRLSLVAVGRLLGDRNHSTISHGIAAIEDRVQHDPELKLIVRRLLLEVPISPVPLRPARLPSSGEWWWLKASYGARFALRPALAA